MTGATSSIFVRHLTCLYDKRVVPMRVRGMIAAGVTHGHWRTAGGEEISLSSQVDYEQSLASRGVIVDQERRREMVRGAIAEMERDVGASAKIDGDQIATIADGVEYPYPVNCQVNTVVDLPLSFIETALSAEGFVPVTGRSGPIRFMAVADGAVEREITRVGYERVARSALRRCEALFSRDRKTPLADHVRILRGISDESGLGSLWDKTERLRTISGQIAQTIGASLEAVDRAAFLCQADLATWVVRKFPSLHGTAGAVYAALDGEGSTVLRALEQRGGATAEGLALAIAQVFDDLCLALLGKRDVHDAVVVGMVDDLIGLMIDGNLSLNLVSLVDPVSEQYRILAPTMSMRDLVSVLKTSLEDRLSHYLEMHEQIPAAIVPAIPRAVRTDPYRSSRCAWALQEASGGDEFALLLASFARLQEHFVAENTRAFDPALLEGESERDLWREYLKAEGKLEGYLAELDYERAIDQLVMLSGPIVRYIEDVDLRDGSESVRNNRRGLIACIVDLYTRVGDFNALVKEKR